jgi:uncharacterized protein
MRIQTEQLKEREITLDFEAPAEAFPALRAMARDGECGFEAPIRVRVRAVRIGDMVEVEGRLDTAAQLACGRCLREFAAPLAGEFALTYTHAPKAEASAAAEPEKEIDPAEVGLISFRGEEIDLTEAVQEQVILALPLRALCAEACRGLCAGCGADLNQADCTCARPDRTGPFAALRGIHLKQE